MGQSISIGDLGQGAFAVVAICMVVLIAAGVTEFFLEDAGNSFLYKYGTGIFLVAVVVAMMAVSIAAVWRVFGNQ